MFSLSEAQKRAMLSMGDTIRANGGKRLADPAVNGRTLAVLEREGLVERMDSDGTWRLTAAGRKAYQNLDIARTPEVVDVPAVDTVFRVGHVIVWAGEAFVIEGFSEFGRAKVSRFHNAKQSHWMDRPIQEYARWGEVVPVRSNCGTCGPRAQAVCGWCYPCNVHGDQVGDPMSIKMSPAVLSTVVRELNTEPKVWPLGFPGAETVVESFTSKRGKRVGARKSRNRW